jgi:UDP-N-acetylglucosamine:LPS N-acetylglucosamine transferase
MTKPGYGTIVEAVTVGLPVVYVRRYNFADEQPLVDFLHRYGRACELPIDDFLSGNWQPALESVHTHPSPSGPPPTPTGAHDAAGLLAAYF